MYVYVNFYMCGCVHVYVCLCANNVVCNRMEDKHNSKKLCSAIMTVKCIEYS